MNTHLNYPLIIYLGIENLKIFKDKELKIYNTLRKKKLFESLYIFGAKM